MSDVAISARCYSNEWNASSSKAEATLSKEKRQVKNGLFNAKRKEKQFLEERNFLETQIKSMQEEIQLKSKTISRLEVEISVTKFDLEYHEGLYPKYIPNIEAKAFAEHHLES